MEAVEVQLARLDEQFKFLRELPKQIDKLESKIDALSDKLSSDFVRKDELDKLLSERKSALLSWQNIVWAVVILILNVIVSYGINKP